MEAWAERHDDWERKSTNAINVYINAGSQLFQQAGDDPLTARRKAVDFMVDRSKDRYKAMRREMRRRKREDAR